MSTDHGLDELTEARLRKGLLELAALTPEPATRRRPHVWLTAAAVLALASAGTWTALARDGGGGADHRASRAATVTAPATTTPTDAASTGSDTTQHTSGMMVAYDLPRLVAESQRIVVGTVTGLRHVAGDDEGNLPYTLATVRISEALRGPAGEVTAFDYDLGGTSADQGGPAWVEGQQLLLFLSDPAGTVHAAIQPEHWQVSGGWQGRYPVVSGQLQAPFTLDDVRAQVR
jgi:hypothetical protein